jgi:MYXO-CTERM domain-containing protein
MAQYDPQRSRSRHRSGEDEGPAPVDALLGPTDPPATSSGASPGTGAPGLIDLTDSAPSPTGADPAANGTSPAANRVMAGGPAGPGPVRPVVIVLAIMAALALVWAWRRRRHTPRDDD